MQMPVRGGPPSEHARFHPPGLAMIRGAPRSSSSASQRPLLLLVVRGR
jgi:hypothetical protein